VQKELVKENDISNTKSDQLEIIFYTDPLCCWSFAIEPSLIHLQQEYGTKISLRYCMGGLLSDWNNYYDQINNISRPIQMGPLWMYAQQITGVRMNSSIWVNNPPKSSYPACIAVKAAFLQSFPIGQQYLNQLRKSLLVEGKDTSNENILIKNARKLAINFPDFDMDRFFLDFKNGNALEAFREDLKEVEQRRISRFPTLLIRNQNKKGVIVNGFRRHKELKEILTQMATL
jgi:putative protein-disulfide isomerase